MSNQSPGRGVKAIGEVSLGLTVLGVLLAIFVCAAYHKFGGPSAPPPAAINSINSLVGEEDAKLAEAASEQAAALIADSRLDPAPSATQPEIPKVGSSNLDFHDDSDLPSASYTPNPDSLEQSSGFALPAEDSDSPTEIDSRPEVIPVDLNWTDPNRDDDVRPPPVENNSPSLLPQSESPGGDLNSQSQSLDGDARPNNQQPLSDADSAESSKTNKTARPSSVVTKEYMPPSAPNIQLTSTAHVLIQPNDSFWSISLRSYGNGTYFKALYEYNRNRFPDPDQLPAGNEIAVPDLHDLCSMFPQLCPPQDLSIAPTSAYAQLPKPASIGRSYVVKPGDSLFDIARHQLGQASRYVEIIQLNGQRLGDNHDNLQAGLELSLPEE